MLYLIDSVLVITLGTKFSFRLKRPNTSAQTDFLANGYFLVVGWGTGTNSSTSSSELSDEETSISGLRLRGVQAELSVGRSTGD
jgi:hypothetical protein